MGCLFLDRSPRRSSTNAARGGLKPPPAGRLRRANSFISRTASSIQIRAYLIGLLSMFVTHGSAKSWRVAVELRRHAAGGRGASTALVVIMAVLTLALIIGR